MDALAYRRRAVGEKLAGKVTRNDDHRRLRFVVRAEAGDFVGAEIATGHQRDAERVERVLVG